MSDPRYYTGEPRWNHDDECSWHNICAECLAANEERDTVEWEERRAIEEREAEHGDRSDA